MRFYSSIRNMGPAKSVLNSVFGALKDGILSLQAEGQVAAFSDTQSLRPQAGKH